MQNLTLFNNIFHAPKHSNGMSVFVYVGNGKMTFETVTIEIRNSTFNSNQGSLVGGALYMVNMFYSPLHVHLLVDGTEFTLNTAANSGVCMYIEKQFVYGRNNIFGVVSVDLVNIAAYNNCNTQNFAKSTLYHEGIGMFDFVEVDKVTVNGTDSNGCIFSDNHGSVIDAYSTDIELIGHILFQYNVARIGAAISLRGMSYLLLTDHLSASFIGNHALTHGGAIYAEGSGIRYSLCAFQIHHLCAIDSISLSFTNNSADLGGHSL